MQKPQYAILHFVKYKGPEIGQIEAHNERKKEKYASNPDIDTSRSYLNFHLVQPERKYRAEAERQIAQAGCRTRRDSVRVVEALVTASPEFFKGKKQAEVRTFFEEAVRFIERRQPKDTIISAVVHMDEKTPHMHLSFVPLTKDGRLSAKDIVGNKKKLTWWQDQFWKHMVRRWPDLERGESASETGRTHIPPRLFKEAAHLNRQRDMLMKLLGEVNPLNAKKKSAEIEALLERYIPGVERMQTQMRKYDTAYKALQAKNAELKKQVDSSKESVRHRLEVSQQLQELEELKRAVENVPPEILRAYQSVPKIKEFER